jgi:tRNA(Ile)-lysidine synthase
MGPAGLNEGTDPGQAEGADRRTAVLLRRHPVVCEVARRLREAGLEPASGLVVGVSGGADSVSLLVAVATLCRHPPRSPHAIAVEPVAAHVHHHLRPEADEDAAFVEALCRRLGVPYHRRDVYPDRRAGSLAGLARRLRYQALADVARSVGARHVAVAHHAADQLETMLAALCRGAGLRGLSAMRPSRPFGGDLTLLRPLLSLPPAALRELCRAAGTGWREDPGNADLASSPRARLRGAVLPVLQATWPSAAVRAAATAGELAAAWEILCQTLDQAFGGPETRSWPREDLRALPAPLIGAGLRRCALGAAPQVADSLGRALLERAAEAIRDGRRRPRRFQWPGGLVLTVRSRTVELAAADEAGQPMRS